MAEVLLVQLKREREKNLSAMVWFLPVTECKKLVQKSQFELFFFYLVCIFLFFKDK